MPDCKGVDGTPCPEVVRHRYIWAWGDEGFCCDGHRGALETRAGQLNRGLQFAPLYTAPTLSGPHPLGELPPSILELESLKSDVRKREKKSTELEREREISTEKTRGLELRVTELTKQLNDSSLMPELERETQIEKIRGLELRVLELTKQSQEVSPPPPTPRDREVIEGAEPAKKKK